MGSSANRTPRVSLKSGFPRNRIFPEFITIWPWNRQPTFAIGASDITQGIESSQSNKKLKQQILERKRWKTTENINIFQIVGMNQREQRSIVLSLRLKRLSKRPSATILLWCSKRMSCRTWMWRYSTGRLFWAWIRTRPHYRRTMMASMKW
jgi:hypothetical protein